MIHNQTKSISVVGRSFVYLSVIALQDTNRNLLVPLRRSGEGEFGSPQRASRFQLYDPTSIAVGADGRVYRADMGLRRLMAVGTDGMITTFAGNDYLGDSGDGGPATGAELQFWSDGRQVAIGPDGSIHLNNTKRSTGATRIRRVIPHLPGFSSGNQIVIPDEAARTCSSLIPGASISRL